MQKWIVDSLLDTAIQVAVFAPPMVFAAYLLGVF